MLAKILCHVFSVAFLRQKWSFSGDPDQNTSHCTLATKHVYKKSKHLLSSGSAKAFAVQWFHVWNDAKLKWTALWMAGSKWDRPLEPHMLKSLLRLSSACAQKTYKNTIKTWDKMAKFEECGTLLCSFPMLLKWAVPACQNLYVSPKIDLFCCLWDGSLKSGSYVMTTLKSFLLTPY